MLNRRAAGPRFAVKPTRLPMIRPASPHRCKSSARPVAGSVAFNRYRSTFRRLSASRLIATTVPTRARYRPQAATIQRSVRPRGMRCKTLLFRIANRRAFSSSNDTSPNGGLRVFCLRSHARTMHRLTDSDLRIRLSVQLSVIPTATLRAFAGKQPAAREAAREAIVDQLARKVLGNAIVLVPEPVAAGDYGTRPGTFGVTEPDPLDG